MNLKSFGILIFAILSLTNAFGQSRSADDSIFWEASSGNRTIFLMGNIHVGYPEQYPIRAEILESFKKSKSYVTESLLPFLSNDEIAAQTKVLLGAEPGKTLKDLLDNKQCKALATKENFYSKLDKFFGENGKTKLLKASPRAVIYFLDIFQTPLNTSTKVDEVKFAEPVEWYFARDAKNLQIQHESLDPEYWEGIDALSDIDKCNLAIGLADVHITRNPADQDSSHSDEILRNIWLAGKSAVAGNLGFEWKDSFALQHGNAEHKFFYARNKIMTEKIIAMSKRESSPIFVSVGIAHLAGDNGLLRQLRDAGFDVRPR